MNGIRPGFATTFFLGLVFPYIWDYFVVNGISQHLATKKQGYSEVHGRASFQFKDTNKMGNNDNDTEIFGLMLSKNRF
jgi:hypothetical protein